MSEILLHSDFDTTKYNYGLIDPNLWTCIIPAAGKGTRLNYHKPKILFQINGKNLLQYLTDNFARLCCKIVIISSSNGKKEISEIINKTNTEIQVQSEPKGMSDAIWQARNNVDTKYSIVVWGDQVCLRYSTVVKTVAYHQEHNNLLTFPTVFKKNPYINIIRDTKNRIIKIEQNRENEIKVERGENDCGFFCFSTESLFKALRLNLNNPVYTGKKSKEINLLQMLPIFEEYRGKVTTLRIADEIETLGINTRKDAEIASKILKKRK